MASADGLPEFVRDSKLRTEIEGNQTIHTRPTARRSLSKREIWIVESIVGQGGGGVVLLQRQSEGSNVGHLRAVKRIQLHTGADRNPMSSIRRFIRELEASAKFSQKRYEEYFVKSYGWYHTLDEIYIAMEYCELGDLGRYLRKEGTVPEDEAKDVIHQVVTALGMMHVEGFAHRDLKPSNILIVSKPPDGEWWVKLCDLGLSRRSSDASGSTTMMGTPQCMAPETIGGKFNGDPADADPTKADMWCVGETLFQALTGSRTFDDETLYRYQKSLETFPVSKLESLNITEGGIRFIRSLMAPDPRDRPDARQALRHPWMPADGDLFISHEDDSPFLSNQERLITSSVTNIVLSDQLTQASAQWTTTSPLSHFTSAPTQSSGQWTATVKNPSRSSVSDLSKVVPKVTGQTPSQHLTVDVPKKDDIKEQPEKVLETATLVNERKREAEEPEQSARNEKQEFKKEVLKSPKLTKGMMENVRATIVERQRKLLRETKAVNLNDLKKFSQDFKLKTPVPPDMVNILAKDEQQQREIVEKAHRQAQQFKAVKNEQSRPTASSSTGKAQEDTTTRRDRTSGNMPITQRAGTSSVGQITSSKEPAKPMTWAQITAAGISSPSVAPAAPKPKNPVPELAQSATVSVTKTHSTAPPGRQNYEEHKKDKGGDNQPFPSHQPYTRHQPFPPIRWPQPDQPFRPNPPPYPQPQYLTNRPSYLTNQPSHLTNQPSYLTNQPSYLTNQPPYLTYRPLYLNNQPLYLANQPTGYPYQPYRPYPLNVEKRSD